MTDIIQLSNFNLYLGMAINGLFTGLGVTIGAYISQNHILKLPKRIRKLTKRIRKRLNK